MRGEPPHITLVLPLLNRKMCHITIRPYCNGKRGKNVNFTKTRKCHFHQKHENAQNAKWRKCWNAQIIKVRFTIKTRKHDSLWEAWYPLETPKPEKRRTRRLGNHKVSILPIYLSFWAFLAFFRNVTFFTFSILILSLFDDFHFLTFVTFSVLSLFHFFLFFYFLDFWSFFVIFHVDD